MMPSIRNQIGVFWLLLLAVQSHSTRVMVSEGKFVPVDERVCRFLDSSIRVRTIRH